MVDEILKAEEKRLKCYSTVVRDSILYPVFINCGHE